MTTRNLSKEIQSGGTFDMKANDDPMFSPLADQMAGALKQRNRLQAGVWMHSP